VTNVKITKQERVAIVTLDRPPVNALDYATFTELARAFDSLSSDRTVSAAVLTGGGRIFCGGVDLADSPRRFRPDGRDEDGGPQRDPADQIDPGRVARRCFMAVYDCAVPVIAAVNGPAIGAGTALVGSCDLIVCSTESSFALREINVGVLGGVKHAQRLLGPFKSKRMLLTGERVPPEEFYRLGAVEAVVAPDLLLPTALDLASQITVNSPIAVRLAKESANRVEYLSVEDGYRLEQDYTIRVNRYADAAEARRAFFEKREPRFTWE
jgi:enoyl-CoA hydratase